MSFCLLSAADQGETAEEIASATAAEREEGEEKQRYLKIAEALKDHLKSHPRLYCNSSECRVGGGPLHRGPWTDSDLVLGRFGLETPGLTLTMRRRSINSSGPLCRCDCH